MISLSTEKTETICSDNRLKKTTTSKLRSQIELNRTQSKTELCVSLISNPIDFLLFMYSFLRIYAFAVVKKEMNYV